MGLQKLIEVIQNDTRLDSDCPCLDIQVADASQVAAGIQDQCLAHGLTTLRGATTPWQNGHTRIAGDVESQTQVDQ